MSSGPAARNPLTRGGLVALLAAVAFGATTPFVQKLGREAGAVPTATMLYAGAALASIGRPRSAKPQGSGERDGPAIRGRTLARIVAVTLFGAVIAPSCLAWGLQRTSAGGASLLLNFEAVFTVLLAWSLYREPMGVRVGLALSAMAVGGAILVFGGGSLSDLSVSFGWGAFAVIGATFAWAIDNVLTKPLADFEPTRIVRWKGALGAGLGLVLSLVLSQRFPPPLEMLGLLLCGATGYGISLRLYLLAQRQIGAGRTGSIFALAPFVGAALAWIMGDRTSGATTLLAAGFFAVGVYLHLTEAHRHEHTHDAEEHEHLHRHDDGHHDHAHEPPVEGWHSHAHRHEARTHAHDHGPDLHHAHRH